MLLFANISHKFSIQEVFVAHLIFQTSWGITLNAFKVALWWMVYQPTQEGMLFKYPQEEEKKSVITTLSFFLANSRYNMLHLGGHHFFERYSYDCTKACFLISLIFQQLVAPSEYICYRSSGNSGRLQTAYHRFQLRDDPLFGDIL